MRAQHDEVRRAAITDSQQHSDTSKMFDAEGANADTAKFDAVSKRSLVMSTANARGCAWRSARLTSCMQCQACLIRTNANRR
jgi:hypothetical protein